MNAKKAKLIRRVFGSDKKSARLNRRAYTRDATSASQNPKFRSVTPDVACGRPGYDKPDRMAPHAKPLRAILQIAKGKPSVARILISNALHPMNCGRDPIKFLATGPRTRVNAVLRQLLAA